MNDNSIYYTEAQYEGVEAPNWWRGSEPEIQAHVNTSIQRGRVQLLATSPGGRPVNAVFYGEPEPELRGTANFNSAVAAKDPSRYFRKEERNRPVMLIVAGVHGQEMEGMVGCLSLLSILETGRDIRGTEQPETRKLLDKLRVIIVPVANPDGRARVPYRSFVGIPEDEMHRVGQGTRADGSLYGWPGCKAVHPMEGDVGFLGGYFDDSGINLMHDNWASCMSRTTEALLSLTHEEGPDMLLNLHSHRQPPAVLALSYAPMTVKRALGDYAEFLYTGYEEAGIAHGRVPEPRVDGEDDPPPTFNLTSMFYHVGASLPFTHEGPHGLSHGEYQPSHEEILTIYHALFQRSAAYLLQRTGGSS